MNNILLASMYIPTVGPRVYSVGTYKDDNELTDLKALAKEYAAGMNTMDSLELVTLPSEAMKEDTSRLIKELRNRAVAKFAEGHPNEMASENDIRMEEEDVG